MEFDFNSSLLLDSNSAFTFLNSDNDKNEDFEENQQYTIDIEDSIQIQDLDIGFMTNGNSKVSQKLEDQFLIIQSYQYSKNKVLYIYSLRDTSQPLIRFENGEIQDRLLSQIENLNDNLYQQNFLKISKCQDYGSYWGRLYDMHLVIQEMMICLNDQQDQFSQSFYVSHQGQIELIYPFYQEEERVKMNEVKKQIQQKLGIKNQGQIFTLYFNQKYEYKNADDLSQIKDYLQDMGLKYWTTDTQCIFMEDMIIVIYNRGVLDVFTIKLYHEIQKSVSDIQQEQKGKLLQQMLSDFDHNVQHEVYQENYLYESKYSMVNQQIDSYYLNSKKQGVFTTHNKCFIGNKQYQFDQSQLLIDLGGNSQNDCSFKIIQLYHQDVKNLKLLKYHTTFNSAVFFFLHRNKNSLGDSSQIQENQEACYLKGVYFFVILSIQELQILAIQKKPLIDYGRNIFIPINLNNITHITYNESLILSFHGFDKYINFTKNEIQFEIFRDLGDPTNKFFPFFFQHQVGNDQENNLGIYEHYLCFMEVDRLLDEISTNQYQEDIEFPCFIQAFKMDYYQKFDEPIELKSLNQSQYGLRADVLSSSWRSQSMFQRSSNFQYNKKEKQIQALFQVGTNMHYGNWKEKSIHNIEIKEYLVTFSNNKSFYKNFDQEVFIKVDQDLYQSKIRLQPIQIKYLSFGQEYLSKILSSWDNCFPIENNKLLPIVDDIGNIEGIYALINHKQSNHGICKISSNDQNFLSNILTNKKDRYNFQSQQKLHLVFITKKDFDTFDGYFSDGSHVQGIQYEQIDEISQKFVNYPLSNIQMIIDEFKSGFKPVYVYDVFEIENKQLNYDVINSISSPLTQMSILRNHSIILSKSNFSIDCIQQNYFNKKESIYWLYYFSKFLFCISLFDFNELFYFEIKQINWRFFQPRFILKGKSLLGLNTIDLTIPQIDSLFNMKKDNNYTFLQNSLASKIEENNQNINLLQRFVSSFELEPYFDLQCNFLQQESLIQSLFEAKKMKEVLYLVEYMIKENNNKLFVNILTQDLPQLLQSQKFNMNEFLNIQEENKYSISQKNDEAYNRVQNCNLEQLIVNSKLEIFGSCKILTNLVQKFKGMFLTEEEILEIIQNSQKDEEQENKVQVQYSIIDLKQTQRKIKIDVFLNRYHNKKARDVDYLDLFQINQDIKCSHLFLIKLIQVNKEAANFFDQSTVQQIIDIQYITTRPFIQNLLILYLVGFILPFLYNCLSTIYIEHLKTESKAHYKLRMVLYTIAIITQIFFIVLEFAEIKFNGLKKYFHDSYNMFDSTQPFIFCLHLILRNFYLKYIDGFGLLKLGDNIIQIIIIVGSATKILQYIRFKEEYSFFVQMFTSVIIELIPLMMAFVMFTIIFSLISIIMQVNVDEGDDGDDYKDVQLFMKQLIQTFRISVGDIQVNKYEGWANATTCRFKGIVQPLAIFIIWLFWFINVFIMLIIMLNLVIAQVSQIYDKVMSQGKSSVYKERAELNKQVFQILYFFGYKYEFDAIIIQKAQNNMETFKFDDITTFSARIKKSTQEQINKMKEDLFYAIKQNFTNTNQKVDEQKQFLNEIKQIVESKINETTVDLKLQVREIKQRQEYQIKRQENAMSVMVEAIQKLYEIQKISNPALKVSNFTQDNKFQKLSSISFSEYVDDQNDASQYPTEEQSLNTNNQARNVNNSFIRGSSTSRK